MPNSPNPASYADIKPILDAALAAGGGQYRPLDERRGNVPTREAATRFRARAYAFRTALAKMQDSGGILGPPTTPYDHMVIRIDPNDPTIVWINNPTPQGQLTDLKGRPLDVAAPDYSYGHRDSSGSDPLLDQARKQAEELGLD